MKCPYCERELKESMELAGKQVQCPGCGNPFVCPPMASHADAEAQFSEANPYTSPQFDNSRSELPSQEEWKIKAIAIMTISGGGIAIFIALMNFVLALGLCITLLTGAYSTVVGVLCLVTGIPMLQARPRQVSAPYPTAIMQIINVLACDPFNLAMGIVIVIFLADENVRNYYR